MFGGHMGDKKPQLCGESGPISCALTQYV